MCSVAPLILIFDDDPAVLDALRFELRLDGFRVDAYRHGAPLPAMQLLQCASCVLVSDALPVTDGFELVERLQSQRVRAPIVFLAARATPQIRCRAAKYGIQHVVEKPLIDDSLANAMLDLLPREPWLRRKT